MEQDGLVSISTRALIELRHAAQNLPLKIAKVRALQTGQYYSPFRGRGMEFDEVRPYQPGDDVRTLDWRVTARTGKPHTKLFREERERAVIVWSDLRRSMFFGTRKTFKSIVAAQAAGLLAWSAHHHGDRIGGLIFNDDKHHELRPKSGKKAVLHFLQLMSSMSDYKEYARRSFTFNDNNEQSQIMSVQQALGRLRRVARPGSLLLMISDFRNFDEQNESHLIQLAKQNDVVLIMVFDPMEKYLPPAGLYKVSDEQRTVTIDTSDNTMRDDYEHRFAEHVQRFKDLCKRFHMYHLLCSTDADVAATLQVAFGLKQSNG